MTGSRDDVNERQANGDGMNEWQNSNTERTDEDYAGTDLVAVGDAEHNGIRIKSGLTRVRSGGLLASAFPALFAPIASPVGAEAVACSVSSSRRPPAFSRTHVPPSCTERPAGDSTGDVQHRDTGDTPTTAPSHASTSRPSPRVDYDTSGNSPSLSHLARASDPSRGLCGARLTRDLGPQGRWCRAVQLLPEDRRWLGRTGFGPDPLFANRISRDET